MKLPVEKRHRMTKGGSRSLRIAKAHPGGRILSVRPHPTLPDHEVVRHATRPPVVRRVG